MRYTCMQCAGAGKIPVSWWRGHLWVDSPPWPESHNDSVAHPPPCPLLQVASVAWSSPSNSVPAAPSHQLFLPPAGPPCSVPHSETSLSPPSLDWEGRLSPISRPPLPCGPCPERPRHDGTQIFCRPFLSVRTQVGLNGYTKISSVTTLTSNYTHYLQTMVLTCGTNNILLEMHFNSELGKAYLYWCSGNRNKYRLYIAAKPCLYRFSFPDKVVPANAYTKCNLDS